MFTRTKILTSTTARYFASLTQISHQQLKLKEKPARIRILHEKYGVHYTKLDVNDKELQQMITLINSRRKQEKDRQIIVEGRQLVCEAVQNYLKLNHLLFANIKNAEPVLDILGKSAESVNLLRVPREDLSFYSILTTCPGLIGIFSKPKVKPKKNAWPITVICDNVREPQNIGAVLRLSNALPARRVVLPKGNADQWDPKAIRGSSGSVFFIPSEDSMDWEALDQTEPEESLVLIADNNVDKYPVSKVLNFEEIPEDLLMNKDIYVILGGETHGVSENAMYFASKRDWRAVNIQIDPTCNSLNTSNALAVILFELRRKLRMT